MALGEFIAGCIGFFIGILVLDVWCLLVFRTNLFRKMKDALKDPLEPTGPVAFAKVPSRLDKFPSVCAIESKDGRPSVTDFEENVAILFSLEGKGFESSKTISCGLAKELATGKPAVHVQGTGIGKGEWLLHCYNYQGEVFCEIEGGTDIVPVLKERNAE